MEFSDLVNFEYMGRELHSSITHANLNRMDPRELEAFGFNLASIGAIAYIGIKILVRSYFLPATGILFLGAIFYARGVCKAAMFSGPDGTLEAARTSVSNVAAAVLSFGGLGDKEELKRQLPGYTPWTILGVDLLYITPRMKMLLDLK